MSWFFLWYEPFWHYAFTPQIVAGVVFWTGYWLVLKAAKWIDWYQNDRDWDPEAFYAAEQAAFRADYVERKRAYLKANGGL